MGRGPGGLHVGELDPRRARVARGALARVAKGPWPPRCARARVRPRPARRAGRDASGCPRDRSARAARGVSAVDGPVELGVPSGRMWNSASNSALHTSVHEPGGAGVAHVRGAGRARGSRCRGSSPGRRWRARRPRRGTSARCSCRTARAGSAPGRAVRTSALSVFLPAPRVDGELARQPELVLEEVAQPARVGLVRDDGEGGGAEEVLVSPERQRSHTGLIVVCFSRSMNGSGSRPVSSPSFLRNAVVLCSPIGACSQGRSSASHSPLPYSRKRLTFTSAVPSSWMSARVAAEREGRPDLAADALDQAADLVKIRGHVELPVHRTDQVHLRHGGPPGA